MAFTIDDLTELLATRATEGLYLELKRGAALTRGNGERGSDPRAELVKDCSGFANAAGGRIVYGVSEELVDGVNVAAGLSPVSDAGIGQNWIAEVLRSNTSPPLSRFHITELPVADGRVIVVDVDQSFTAHQNLKDQRYYQRTGPTTVPMVDFQIRDVMARRTRPEVAVRLTFQAELRSANLHRYALAIEIENIGGVTLKNWWLDVDIPAAVVRDTRHPGVALMAMEPRFRQVVRQIRVGGRQIERVSVGDPNPIGGRMLLHPEQTLSLDRSNPKFAEILLEVDNAIFGRFDNGQDAGVINWTIYFENSPPQKGAIPFDQWSQF